MMELSKRLQAVAGLVSEGMVVADVGTDHGYLPIRLLNTGKCEKAFALDLRPGPLMRAREHREAFLERGELKLCLSDGLKALEPGEAECIVLAGMGGGLMIRILEEGKAVAGKAEECILQPQSETARVRAWLLEQGYAVLQEEMVKEEGKYYPMMKAAVPAASRKTDGKDHRRDDPWTEEELCYGKLLLQEKHPVLMEYLQKERRVQEEILQKISRKKGAHIRRREEEVRHRLELVLAALARYDV